jgi:hypothetical protein
MVARRRTERLGSARESLRSCLQRNLAELQVQLSGPRRTRELRATSRSLTQVSIVLCSRAAQNGVDLFWVTSRWAFGPSPGR